jgi:hypothetical protein
VDVDGEAGSGMKLDSIQVATGKYEQWLRRYLHVVPADLELKHQQMAAAPFSFFRATFYRWMQLWRAGIAGAPGGKEVLAVGDLHVENFGTWRDAEARLVWGINDFDEAYKLPYTIDLVRLATSAHLAIESAHLTLAHDDACDSVLEGYRQGIASHGVPFVLAEKNPWLRMLVSGELRDPEHFWAKLEALNASADPVPSSAIKAVGHILPDARLQCRWVHRVAGLGSLGRQRFVALGTYAGSHIAREAKALCPSACAWAAGKTPEKSAIYYQDILDGSVRAIDPFVRPRGQWVARRLAPDCSRVELTSLPRERDESRLLQAMGFETANVHLSNPQTAKAILADLKKRPKRWLHKAAAAMHKATLEDFAAWKG